MEARLWSSLEFDARSLRLSMDVRSFVVVLGAVVTVDALAFGKFEVIGMFEG